MKILIFFLALLALMWSSTKKTIASKYKNLEFSPIFANFRPVLTLPMLFEHWKDSEKHEYLCSKRYIIYSGNKKGTKKYSEVGYSLAY